MKIWASNILFLDLNEEQLSRIEPYVQPVNYGPGVTIMEEGDAGDFMLLVDQGVASIYKNELKLAEKVGGEFLGLMSLLDESPRSATVLAGPNGLKGHVITKEGLAQIMQDEKQSAVSGMLRNYIHNQQNAIRNTNALGLQEARAKLEQERKRVQSAQFFVQMVVGLIFFMFVMGFLQEKAHQVDSTFISFGVIIVYGLWSFSYVRMSGLPLKSFGITTKNLRPSIRFCLSATAVFIGFLFFIKWIMVTYFSNIFGSELIEIYKSSAALETPLWLLLIVYCVHAVGQEFIARGCIQGGLLQFIMGPRAGWTAILVATLMFSSFHLIQDIRFALLTIIPGLFWGFLFYKHQNIWAVSISHILIGVVAVFILGLV